MPNIEGAFSAEEIEGKFNIILKLDIKNQSANELAETIAHGLALHGSDLDKIINLKSATYRVSWEFTCKTTKILLLYIFLAQQKCRRHKIPLPHKAT